MAIPKDKQETHKLQELLDIMEQLRDPKTGCPWDIAQTSDSISQYTIEEAYEVVEAIKSDNSEELCDELGDLLFQVVFHAQISKENELFQFSDVVDKATKKMIRRHPHIFKNNGTKKTIEDQKSDWEHYKSEERSKNRKTDTYSELDNIPNTIPENYKALKIQNRAANVGFDWVDFSSVINKINEELKELIEAKTEGNVRQIEEEYGDLIFTVINLGRHLNLHPDNALGRANQKFIKRFKTIEDNLRKAGKTIKKSNYEELNFEWTKVKQKQRKNTT